MEVLCADEPKTGRIVKTIAMVFGLGLFSFYAGIISASVPTPPPDVSYEAPWMDFYIYTTDAQNNRDYSCVSGDSGSVESCAQQYYIGLSDPYNSGWLPHANTVCSTYGYLPIGCFGTTFSHVQNGGGTFNEIGQNCLFGGDTTGVALNDPFGKGYLDWCLFKYAGQAIPPPGGCPTGSLQDPQGGQCYNFGERNTGTCGCPGDSNDPTAGTPSNPSGPGAGDPGVGDPINAASGNLYEAATDYIGTGPFPLVFKRTYNSAIANQGASPDGADQSMGVGWTNSLTGHLFVYVTPAQFTVCTDNSQYLNDGVTPNPDLGVQYLCPAIPQSSPGSVTIWHPDGSQSVFTGQFYYGGEPTGSLQAEPGVSGQLIYGGGNYRYIRNDGYVETYNASGQLTSVQDKYGATQRYAYNYIINNGLNVLTSLVITDTNGRSMTITYNANGLVTQMTDPAGNQYNYGYDTTTGDPGYGNLISLTYNYSSPIGASNGTRQVTYLYGDPSFPHALTGILDENESANPSGPEYSSWTYDSQGRATSSQHAGGQDLVTLTYNSDGTTDVTEPTSAVRHLTFQQVNGRYELASASKHCLDCGKSDASVGYDANGHVDKVTDFRGNVTTYQMDPVSGLELSRTEAYGDTSPSPVTRTITTTWCGPVAINGSSCILPFVAVNSITEPGRTTQFNYTLNSNNVVSKVIKTITDTATSATRIYTYNYDGAGHITSITGPRSNNATTLVYYSQNSAGNYNIGDLSSVSADGLSTHYLQYDSDGKPTKITDPNGVQRLVTYDSREQVAIDETAVGTAMDHDTFYYYYPNGLLNLYDPVNGPSYTYIYDNAHRLLSVYDGYVHYLEYAYSLDSQGYHVDEYAYDCNVQSNCTTGFPPTPGTGTFAMHRQRIRSYNGTLDQLQEIGGAGQVTTYTYDANGNVQILKSPGTGSITVQKTYNYDALNRVASVVDDNSDKTGGSSTYVLDPLDHLTAFTSPGGVTTSYTVDAFGEITKTVSPDSGTSTVDYTNWISAGQVVHTNADGDVLTYNYDALNRLSTITNTSNSAKDITYTWDNSTTGYYGLGRLGSLQDITGTTTYQYDPDGNVVKKVAAINGHSATIQYAYSPAGHDLLTSITYPTGTAGVNYKYDYAAGLSVTEIDGWYMTGGTKTTYAIASGIAYAPFGPMTSLTYGNGLVETRQYDGDYRLTNLAVSGGIQNHTYSYYPDGTMSAITDNLTSNLSQAFTYDGLDRVTSAVQSGGYGTDTYSYMNPTTGADMDGNRTQWMYGAAPTNYVYQGLNDGSEKSASNILLSRSRNGTTWNYSYDGNGEIEQDPTYTYRYDVLDTLTQLHLVSNGSLAAIYEYNGLWQRVEKTVGTAVTNFIYDESGHLLAEEDGSGNVLRTHVYMGDRPIAFFPNGDMSTPVKYIHTDQIGTPRYMTNSSGTLIWYWQSDPFGNGTRTAISNGSTYFLGMPGQYLDSETGLYYNNARYYNAILGRYQESDPIGLDGGINTYTYVDNDPLDFIDPAGNSKIQGQASVSGNDPLVSGITKNSSEQEIQAAINRIESALKDPAMPAVRKKFLRAWMKVAKRGFTRSVCPPLVDEIVTNTLENACRNGDFISCAVLSNLDPDDSVLNPFGT